jgi:iron complex outermembrane receptor protein
MKKIPAIVFSAVLPILGAPLFSQEDSSLVATEEVITLSEFEVEATEGKGYFSSHSVTGLKTNKLLIDIPQSVGIVSRDMLDDLSIKGGSSIETAKFAVSGMVPRNDYRYETPIQRGFRSGRTLVDGFRDTGHNMMDKVIIDHVEIVKGPTQVLWGQRNALSGIVSKQTKKPRFTSNRWVRSFFYSEGGFRFEADATGPIIKKKRAEDFGLAYRAIGAYEDRDSVTAKEAAVFRDQWALHGALTASWGQKFSVMAYVSYLNSYNKDNAPNDFIRKDSTTGANGTGELFVGTGGRFQLRQPAYTFDEMKIKMFSAIVDYQFNDNWAFRANGFHQRSWRHPNQIRNFKKDFEADTITFWGLEQEAVTWYKSVTADIRGKTNWLNLGHEINFGVSWDENDSFSRRWDVGQGGDGVDFVFPTLKLSNPDFTNFPQPLQDEKWLRTDRARGRAGGVSNVSNYYYQHNLEVLKEKLFVVAGTGYSQVKNNGGGDEDDQSDWVRRAGLVFKVKPDIAIYFNNSTKFDPVTRRDQNNDLLNPQQGIVYEVGVKTAMWNGRFTSTIAWFDLRATNIPVSVPGENYHRSSGEQVNQGWEIDLGFEPVKNWQLIVTAYAGDIKDANTGVPLNDSVNNTYSFMTAYNFTEGNLKGLRVGLAGYWCGRRFYRNGGGEFPPWHTFSGWIRYKKNNWAFGVHLENLTDEYYPHGGYDPFNMVAPGPPFNAKFSIERSF